MPARRRYWRGIASKMVVNVGAAAFLVTVLSGCGTTTYPGFTEKELSEACGQVYNYTPAVTSVSECLSAADQNGYRTRYTLTQLRAVCQTLIAIQRDVIDKKLGTVKLFDAEITYELFHGGPGIIYYRVPPGAFLPASCAKVIAANLVQPLNGRRTE
ncbi:MAG TPA: hypothetical protein VEJ84_06040 [Acidimicrobiales bacterium]|nr:hypothetical protein [Acidimicrobiales bacterium]